MPTRCTVTFIRTQVVEACSIIKARFFFTFVRICIKNDKFNLIHLQREREREGGTNTYHYYNVSRANSQYTDRHRIHYCSHRYHYSCTNLQSNIHLHLKVRTSGIKLKKIYFVDLRHPKNTCYSSSSFFKKRDLYI